MYWVHLFYHHCLARVRHVTVDGATSSINPVDPSDFLSNSLAIVLDDEGFKVSSPRATEALSVAK